MQITVNGELQECAELCKLSELTEQLPLKSTDGIAIAVNEEVIAKQEWTSKQLQSGDHIIIIQATQGG